MSLKPLVSEWGLALASKMLAIDSAFGPLKLLKNVKFVSGGVLVFF